MAEIRVKPDETAQQLREHVRANPALVKDEYRHPDDPIQGACYMLAEAYFHARGGPESDLKVFRLGWDEVYDDAAGAHWFLRDGPDGPVIDLSLPEPSDGEDIPWSLARGRAFITGWTPSNRTQRVLDALDISY